VIVHGANCRAQIDVSVNAPEAGTIKEFLANEEDTVTVGQDLVRLEAGETGGADKQAGQEVKEPAPAGQKKSSDPQEDGKPSKDEHKPPPQEEKAPSPPKENKAPPPSKADKAPPPPPPSKAKDEKKSDQPKPAESPFGRGTRGENRVCVCSPFRDILLTHTQVKMNRMRLRIAERLKQSQNTAASLTTFNEVDMSNIMEFRKLYKDDVLKKTGVKLGFMSAFAKACILAMKEIPAVNASIEGPGGGDTIVYRDYVDISVAVATPKGLVTPVVRNAESLDMIGIEQAIGELGKKVRGDFNCGA